MNKICFLFSFFFFSTSSFVFSQKIKTEETVIVQDTLKSEDIDPLTPSKAAFYSAILPGLGQAYNKKYWKIPLVYGAIGTSMYFYLDSNKNYKAFRNEYKRRLEGFEPAEDFEKYSDAVLIRGQRLYQRNRDLSSLFVLAFYALNIIDANVDAALIQFNVNENLSFTPEVEQNNITLQPSVGVTFNYRF